MSKTSKTEQENKPPAWAEPLFKASANDAMDLYKSGSGGNTYLGSTVAPLSGTTMQGVNQLAQAGQGWNTAGTRPLYQQLGAASADDPTVNKLNAVADQAGQPTSAATNLQGYASGANLSGEGNPFYRQRLEGELDDTAAQLRSLHSGMGRSGSDFSVRQLTESLADKRIGALENDWNREQQNQFNAVGMIDSANQGAMGLQGNLLSSAGALRGAGLDRAKSSADAMAGLDQQNFENRLAGAGAALQAGGILDTQAQKQIQDEVAKFYALDNQDWSRLGLLQSAAAGAAGPYGTQMATTRQPFNPLSAVAPLFGGK